jgi:phosphoribosylformylglycinamidine synthase subunit PurQ / glutaminase
MKFGVVIFPGSNCDKDLIHVLQNVMGCEVRELWHKDSDISDFSTEDCIMLPGGFSFGDYLRTGAIARFSPIMESVIEFANKGGKVWGICNGFQILCEAGLLPGVLLRNEKQQFSCKNVFIKPTTLNSDITNSLELNKALQIPIAHAEGRWYADDATVEKMKSNDQILFKYCDENGSVDATNNPNGSIDNIAGICNEGRNVFGMMPHPERCAESALGNEDGRGLFVSMVKEVMSAN